MIAGCTRMCPSAASAGMVAGRPQMGVGVIQTLADRERDYPSWAPASHSHGGALAPAGGLDGSRLDVPPALLDSRQPPLARAHPRPACRVPRSGSSGALRGLRLPPQRFGARHPAPPSGGAAERYGKCRWGWTMSGYPGESLRLARRGALPAPRAPVRLDGRPGAARFSDPARVTAAPADARCRTASERRGRAGRPTFWES